MTAPFELKDKHVLAIFLAFFGVVTTVNAVFITFAVRTHVGTVSPNAYAEGLRYNARIAEAARQDAMGVHYSLNVEGDRARLTLTARDAAALNGVAITAHASRPVAGGTPHTLHLREIGPGAYEAPLTLAAGGWIVEFAAEKDGVTLYRGKERLWLKPTR